MLTVPLRFFMIKFSTKVFQKITDTDTETVRTVHCNLSTDGEYIMLSSTMPGLVSLVLGGALANTQVSVLNIWNVE